MTTGGTLHKHLLIWIQEIEKSGSEMPLTLVVSGRLISGFLTPSIRVMDWQGEVLRRAQISGKFVVPPRIGPMNEKQKNRAQEYQRELEEEAAKEGDESGDEQDIVSRAMQRVLYLRDATIHGFMPAGDRDVPFLAIALTAIDAYFLGAEGIDADAEPSTT